MRPVAPTLKVWLLQKAQIIKFLTDLSKVLPLVGNIRDAFRAKAVVHAAWNSGIKTCCLVGTHELGGWLQFDPFTLLSIHHIGSWMLETI